MDEDIDRRGAARSWALLIYGLYLAALFTALPLLVGGIVALLKRETARGTVYESHLDNQVTVFWVSLLFGILGWMLLVVGIGGLVWGVLWVWVLWRSSRGLWRALDGRPYR
jgi:uncharacterized membrane protein